MHVGSVALNDELIVLRDVVQQKTIGSERDFVVRRPRRAETVVYCKQTTMQSPLSYIGNGPEQKIWDEPT